ncbi:hypothetical protein ACFQ88_38990 [Paenibacillus sp. NPDC056579]|uniref:hypothetical protein n=1 Tax=Paenibacillus sp. NPDC056579 TaxID=3345871 RepID=UPI00367A8C91
MKVFILSIVLVLLATIMMVNSQDHNTAQRYLYDLKFVAEEAAAAAAQYYVKNQYAQGRYQFDQDKGIVAAEYVIKKNLKLDDQFVPLSNSYWQEKITYSIEFFDDLNTTYPYLYQHTSGDFTLAIGDPTVVVTINAGKARYRVLTAPSLYRTAAHTFKER